MHQREDTERQQELDWLYHGQKGAEQTNGLHFEVQVDISRCSKDWGMGRNARSGQSKVNARDREAGQH